MVSFLSEYIILWVHNDDLKGLDFCTKKVAWFQEKDCWWRIGHMFAFNSAGLEMGSFDAVVVWNGGSGDLFTMNKSRGEVGAMCQKRSCETSTTGNVIFRLWNVPVRMRFMFTEMACRGVFPSMVVSWKCVVVFYIYSSCIVPICKNHWCRYYPKGLAGFQLQWGWGMHRALELDFETEVWEKWAWWKLLVWWILKITDPLTAQSRMIIVGFTHKHSKASLPCSHCG